jgi:glycosyltransferase involved in cell wall biosynthesis
MNKNKVLFFTHDHADIGPIARRLSLLCKGLNESNMAETRIISTYKGYDKNEQDVEYKNSYKIVCINRPLKISKLFYFISSFFNGIALISLIRKFNPGYIVLYESLIYRYIGVILWCKIKRIIIIADVTEWYEFKVRRLFSPHFIEHFLFRTCYFKMLSGVISISTFYQNYFLSKGFNTIYIPALSDDKIINGKTVITDIKIITYVGRLAKRDEPEKMIEAFKIICNRGFNIKIQLIGKVDSSHYSQNILKMIKNDLVLSRNIEIKGFLEDSEYDECIRKTDFFILLHENTQFSNACFPTRLPEFLIYGRPVITSAVTDITRFMSNGNDIIFVEKENNPINIAEKISFLIENPEKARILGDAGSQKALEVFSYKQHAIRLNHFIRCLKDDEI